MKRPGRAWLAAIALTVATSACSSEPPSAPDNSAATSPEETGSSKVVGASGVDVSLETDAGTVTISAGPEMAPTGTMIGVEPIESVDTGNDAALVLAPSGVSITLGDGQQPNAPMTLELRVAADDDTFDDLDDDVVPVVVATSESAPDTSELIPATWESSTRTLTATTTHLTDFRYGTLDYSRLRETVKENVEGFIGSATDAPSCLGSSVTIGETTYDAIAPDEQVVYPCVSDNSGKLAVTLYSNSPLGWITRSVPPPVGRSEMADISLTPALNAGLYASLLESDLGDGALLHSRGVTELLYDPADVPRRIDLRAQAAMTLVDVASHGTSMWWGGNKLADATNPGDLETLAQCVADPVPWDKVGSLTSREVGEVSRKALDCTHTAIGLSLKSESMSIAEKARKSLGSVMTGLASLPKSAELLDTTLTGLGGEFNGRNTATVIIRARGNDAADISGVPDEVFTIDRIELDNKLTEPVATGRKIGPYLYQLSTGTMPESDIAFAWSAITIDGERYNGEHCQITVTLDGPEADRHEDIKSGRCSDGYASSFGGLTKFTVQTPGVYTLRLQDAVTGLSAESTFTVQR